jgi:hypothetical protein
MEWQYPEDGEYEHERQRSLYRLEDAPGTSEQRNSQKANTSTNATVTNDAVVARRSFALISPVLVCQPTAKQAR